MFRLVSETAPFIICELNKVVSVVSICRATWKVDGNDNPLSFNTWFACERKIWVEHKGLVNILAPRAVYS